MAKNDDLKTASVLAFERRLDVSDGYFWQISSQQKDVGLTHMLIRKKSVRGTISNRLNKTIAADPVKLNAEIEKPNPQSMDACTLDEDKDVLVVKFSCNVLKFDGKPNVCNHQGYQQKVLDLVANYQQQHGFGELAKRYAMNIANARFLWRNRMGAESVRVTVKFNQESVVFDRARELSLNDFNYSSDELTKLAKWIEMGLNGDEFVMLYVAAEAVVGFGQEVYPSQEMILGDTDKVLYRVGNADKNYAGMHSQKIGNAIRTIDNWYPDAAFPIAVEPYGSVTTLGKAFRQPSAKKDFYSLFDAWVLKDKEPGVEDQHYVMAVLIRGGVFGEKSKEKNKKD